MPRYPGLFGKYLRQNGAAQRSFKRKQLIHPIPVKAYGRVPSAASQHGLYHDEDFNYYTKVSFSLQKTRIKLKPNVFRKDFESRLLNYTLKNVKCTTSALHAITESGGFDRYILDTPPEHLRSKFGQDLREIMYFYRKNPNIAALGANPSVFKSSESRKDPAFALYNHYTSVARHEAIVAKHQARFSPFYLPPSTDAMPSVEPFENSKETPQLKLNLWWTRTKNDLRRRLGQATIMDRNCLNIDLIHAYKKGHGMGGGGPR